MMSPSHPAVVGLVHQLYEDFMGDHDLVARINAKIASNARRRGLDLDTWVIATLTTQTITQMAATVAVNAYLDLATL